MEKRTYMMPDRPMHAGAREDRPATLRLKRPDNAPRRQPRRVPAVDLFRGEREIVILHGSDEYRLRITSNGKLILTK
ncbi:MAG: hemin uptake protein HemP [Alphaproteobacteria bacterium]